jgi:hypothetical protein
LAYVPIKPKTRVKSANPINELVISFSFPPVCTDGRQGDCEHAEHDSFKQTDLGVDDAADDCSDNTCGCEVIHNFREPLQLPFIELRSDLLCKAECLPIPGRNTRPGLMIADPVARLDAWCCLFMKASYLLFSLGRARGRKIGFSAPHLQKCVPENPAPKRGGENK